MPVAPAGRGLKRLSIPLQPPTCWRRDRGDLQNALEQLTSAPARNETTTGGSTHRTRSGELHLPHKLDPCVNLPLVVLRMDLWQVDADFRLVPRGTQNNRGRFAFEIPHVVLIFECDLKFERGCPEYLDN